MNMLAKAEIGVIIIGANTRRVDCADVIYICKVEVKMPWATREAVIYDK